MSKLNIFVCENFSPEFSRVIKDEGFDDVVIKPYLSMCENKGNKKYNTNLLHNSHDNNNDCLILCSKYCDIANLIKENSFFKKRFSNYCFSYFANEHFLNYIFRRGGYLLSLGWLNNWREHIRSAGFNKDTARLFYKDFCKELVFFDSGLDNEAERKLNELSRFLDLPYVIIQFETDAVCILLKSVIYEWRLHKSSQEYSKTITEAQTQCAEYSAILEIIAKIASCMNKRETIEKIKEIFVMVLGAKEFKYWDSNNDNDMPDEIKDFFANFDKVYLKKENRFCIKIRQNEKTYGAIDVSDFLFPQYIEKYFNFTVEIIKFCGLALSNLEQYEKLIESEKKLQHLSFHDSLTGIYNRTYINEIIQSRKEYMNVCVFAFDIDKLKYVNDSFGHLEGDRLICAVADILKKSFRETDIVARIGGDEFIAILPDCNIEMAEMFKKRVNDAIMAQNKKQELKFDIRVSAGFALSENIEDSIEVLIHKADECMYANKNQHKSSN